MNDVLAMCLDLPELRLAQGEVLLRESQPNDRLYVLKNGAFDVMRNGVKIVTIDEPGAFIGEISALLGTPPTATLVATRDSVVHVIADADMAVRTRPELTLAIAQLLARRLTAVTAYLVDIKRQYAGSDTHLSVMDQVLGNLMAMNPVVTTQTGSERDDVPDY